MLHISADLKRGDWNSGLLFAGHNEGLIFMRQEILYEDHPFSEWHGCELDDIRYWVGYGVVCPAFVTTNGAPSLIRQYMNEEDAKKFDAWVSKCKFL